MLLLLSGWVIMSHYVDVPRDERVVSLQPVSAAELQAATPGQAILVEGRIGSETQAQAHGLTAFRYEREVGENRPYWRTIEVARPALQVAVPGGLVRVEGMYRMINAPVIIYAEKDDTTFRYVGFAVESALLAVGTAQMGEHGMLVEADALYGGTQDAFIASRQQAIYMSERAAPVLIGAGAIIATGSFWLALLAGAVRGIVRLLGSLARRRNRP
jgi:hypothetical protein